MRAPRQTSPSGRGVQSEAFVVAAARSPIGTAGHSLASLQAHEIGAPVLQAALARTGLEARDVDDVVLGNCMGPGGNLARMTALAAGFPDRVPGMTLDRQCASGLAAVDVASRMVRGGAGLVLAGGVESTSTAPWRLWPPAHEGDVPLRYTRAPFAPNPADDLEMGLANDLLAAEAGVSRERQDEYAARSHARAASSQQAGVFERELVRVSSAFQDDRPRSGLTVERLSRLRPAFREGGTITAGNSCGLSDGAAVLAVVNEDVRSAVNLSGLRIVATATSGVAPGRPGRALVPAVQDVLTQANLRLDDVSAIEFNEAFAGQVLACCDELSLDPERVCADGGAIALGHPWGASGAVLVVRLFTQLVVQRRGRYGLAAIAAGGGVGVAMLVEVTPATTGTSGASC